MKKIINLSIVFLSVALIFIGFNACENENDYNYDKIVPVLKNFTGTTTPMQGRHYEYVATTRGGSTYTWTTDLTAEVVAIPEAVGAWKTYIHFPDVITITDAPEVISVYETTQGGIVSNTLTDTIFTVIPFAALPIDGSTDVNGGFVSSFSVSPSESDMIYSTYVWETTAGTLTQSPTEPWLADINFSNDDVGTVKISLIETTTTGFKDTSYLEVNVNEYCAVEDFNDFGGIYSGGDFNEYGIDGYNDFTVTVTSVENRTVTISDAFWFGSWGPQYWDETPTAGNAVELTLNLDGTISFDAQRALQTNDEWDYYIHPRGAARWNACGGQIELYIPYWADWDDTYAGDFQAEIICSKTLTDKKNAIQKSHLNISKNTNLRPLPIK